MSKFRAIPAVRHVLRTTFANLSYALHMSWPWMVFIAGFQLIAFMLPFILRADYSGGQTPDELLPRLSVLVILLLIATMLAFASIAVNWHRFMLLGERADGWRRLRLDWPVWRYFGNIILLNVIVLLGMFAVMLGYMAVIPIVTILAAILGDTARAFLMGILSLATVGWLVIAMQRLTIKLPAVAIGHNYGFSDAWAETSGYSLSLLGFILVLLVVGLAVAAAVALPVTGLIYILGAQSLGAQIILAITEVIADWIALIIGINILTTLYGIFAEGRDV